MPVSPLDRQQKPKRCGSSECGGVALWCVKITTRITGTRKESYEFRSQRQSRLRCMRWVRLAWRLTCGVPSPLWRPVPCTRTRFVMHCIMNEVRDEGNCGEVTNRGEEACEDVRKRRVCRCATRTSSRQSCEATNRNRIQGRRGQVSEPNITKPSSFTRAGKSGACAAKVIRLIQGDPLLGSARRACSTAERSVVNTVRVERKSAEVVVLPRHRPVPSGRTKP